jgi:hypothetical protein
MMGRASKRTALAMLFLLAAGCTGPDNARCVRGWQSGEATFLDTDGDGLPDTRVDAKSRMGRSTFVDSNGDGLPDTRIDPR